MRTFSLLLCCMFCAATVQATQICSPDSIPHSTPDSQLVDNGDGTVTDNKTGLMWKKCLEGLSGDNCENGLFSSFTWQLALRQPGTVNNAGGFSGYADWRLPNIRELISIVEEQCYHPAINLNYFPNTPSYFPNSSFLAVWSGSPVANDSARAWHVALDYGGAGSSIRNDNYAVRLVRGGY